MTLKYTLRNNLKNLLLATALCLAGCSSPIEPNFADLKTVRRISFVRNNDCCLFEMPGGNQYRISGKNGVADMVQQYNPPKQIQLYDFSLNQQVVLTQKFAECVYTISANGQ